MSAPVRETWQAKVLREPKSDVAKVTATIDKFAGESGKPAIETISINGLVTEISTALERLATTPKLGPTPSEVGEVPQGLEGRRGQPDRQPQDHHRGQPRGPEHRLTVTPSLDQQRSSTRTGESP